MSSILDVASSLKAPVYSKSTALDRLKDLTLNVGFAKYIAQWGQQLSSTGSISKTLDKANSSIKTFSSSFALAKLVESFDEIVSKGSDLFKALTKQGSKKPSAEKVAKQVFLFGSCLTSGVSSAAKAALAVEKLSASRVKLPKLVNNGLSEATSCLGVVTGVCSVVKCGWDLIDLRKSSDKASPLKLSEINRKITKTQLSLVGKVMSVVSAILGIVALAVAIPVLPFVILALSTAAFAIALALQVRKSFHSASRLHYLKA